MSGSQPHHSAEGMIVYCIEVRGRLGPERSDWFEGMTISGGHDSEGQPVTRLEGPLPDEAALQGVLNHLYALGLALLKVERTGVR